MAQRNPSDRGLHQYAPAVAVLGGGLIVGLLVGYLSLGQSSSGQSPGHIGVLSTTPAAPTQSATPSAAPPQAFAAEQAAARNALEDGTAAADQPTGYSQAAVWVSGWPSPVVAGDYLRRPVEMWGLSTAVTAVAAISRGHGHVSENLRRAIADGIARNEQCRQLRAALELQQLAHGPTGAERAFRQVLSRAGTHPQAGPPNLTRANKKVCGPYFRSSEASGIKDPYAPTVPFTSWPWTIDDAIHFGHALATGSYGVAGSQVLADARRPKAASRETDSETRGLPSNWGAGQVFRGDDLAYWSGWGGAATNEFVASQVAVLTRDRRTIVLAAAYEPRDQPTNDEVAASNAPEGLAEILHPVARLISQGWAG